MVENNKTPDFFDQIEWPSQPALRDPELWAKSVKAVEMLCNSAQDAEWLDGISGKDTYMHMPHRYDVQGVEVEFLPHWGFYSVGGIHLDVPTSQENIVAAIESVTNLAKLGAKIKMASQKPSEPKA